jgi:hypothetical protein
MRPARGPIALTWALWAVMLAGTAVLVWLELGLHRVGRPDLALQPEELPYPAAALIAATMGGLLVTRRPRHPVGWLLTAFGLLIVVLGIADDYARFGLVARPGSLPAVGLVAILGDVFMFLPVVIGLVLLLTPTGTLPPGRGWRWWAWVTVTASVVHQIGRVCCRPRPMGRSTTRWSTRCSSRTWSRWRTCSCRSSCSSFWARSSGPPPWW